MREKVTKAELEDLFGIINELREAQLPKEARRSIKVKILPKLASLIDRRIEIDGKGPGGIIEP